MRAASSRRAARHRQASYSPTAKYLYRDDNPGHDDEHVQQLDGSGGPAGHLAVCCAASPGCRPVWYRPRCEPWN